jgi:hypothetical protein
VLGNFPMNVIDQFRQIGYTDLAARLAFQQGSQLLRHLRPQRF